MRQRDEALQPTILQTADSTFLPLSEEEIQNVTGMLKDKEAAGPIQQTLEGLQDIANKSRQKYIKCMKLETIPHKEDSSQSCTKERET